MKLIYAIYKIWIGLVFWLSLLILYPFFKIFLSKKKWFPLVFRLKKLWSKIIRILILCPIDIEQQTAFPSPPYIIVSNHSSYLDTVFMFAIIPDYFLFMGKGELLKWPLFRLFFKKMDIPVYRENIRHAYGAYHQCNEALQRGDCIAIYPEGVISPHSPKMLRFKNGAFKMAIQNQVPIVPITWQNNYKILGQAEKISSYSLPATIRVKIHPSIPTEGLSEKDVGKLRIQTFEIIQSSFDQATIKNTPKNKE